MFLSDHQWKFWTFSILYLWKEFSGKRNTLPLKRIFWKTKTFFKKLEYGFFVESTKIENASFSFRTAMSEANVKTNRMVSTKWTYHKERSFASSYFFFFFKFCLSLGARSKELIRSWYDVPTTQMFIFILFVSAGVWFEGAFSLWVSLSKYVQHKVTWIWACTILIYGGIC